MIPSLTESYVCRVASSVVRLPRPSPSSVRCPAENIDRIADAAVPPLRVRRVLPPAGGGRFLSALT